MFFASAAEFRAWLARHHADTAELFVGFYRKGHGEGLTYQEAVDEALCFGWIDGIIKKLDATRYMHRFTPRRPGSIWSLTNIRHVERLKAAGRMQPTGLAAFAARKAAKTGIYAFEQRGQKLTREEEKVFRANARAWAFFQRQAPWYQRKVAWWIRSAKQDATRTRRLAQLVAASAEGRRL